MKTNVCELRKAKGLTQSELAEKLGVTQQAVAKWEARTAMPSLANLLEMAKVLECSVDELVSA